MGVVDILVLGTVALGLAVGLFRGFLLQFTGLAAIIGGLFLADRYHGRLRPIVDKLVTSDHNPAIAFVVIVLFTVLTVAGISRLCRGLIEKLELGAYDRLLGGAFGALKGAVICAGILLTLVTFAADGGSIENAIGASRAGPVLWSAMDRVAEILPDNVGQPVRGFLEKNHLPLAPPPAAAPAEAAPPAPHESTERGPE